MSPLCLLFRVYSLSLSLPSLPQQLSLRVYSSLLPLPSLNSCLSIPVTLYAALKRPDSLLGPKVAALIKAHLKETSQYTATVSGSI